MLRRDFVRAMVSAGLGPRMLLAQQAGKPQLPLPAPVPWPSGLNPQTPVPPTQVADAIAESTAEFFSPTQMATLNRLSDVLMPPVGDKPGAVQSGTPLFLDFYVGESNFTNQKLYTQGLDWLNAVAMQQFKVPFARLDNAKVDTILKPWLRSWMNDHPPTETHADFVNVVHNDIRVATVNSTEWNSVPSVGAQQKTSADLYWLPIEPDIHSPSAHAPHVQAHAAANANQMPKYSR